jgi:hypothetical protein
MKGALAGAPIPQELPFLARIVGQQSRRIRSKAVWQKTDD